MSVHADRLVELFLQPRCQNIWLSEYHDSAVGTLCFEGLYQVCYARMLQVVCIRLFSLVES